MILREKQRVISLEIRKILNSAIQDVLADIHAQISELKTRVSVSSDEVLHQLHIIMKERRTTSMIWTS